MVRALAQAQAPIPSALAANTRVRKMQARPERGRMRPQTADEANACVGPRSVSANMMRQTELLDLAAGLGLLPTHRAWATEEKGGLGPVLVS